jgi:hypothetical protein
MLITLAERTFNDRIRELEGLSPDVSSAEIEHRMEHYAGKLFTWLAEFGITVLGIVENRVTIATFNAALERCYDEQSRADRLRGLRALNPLSVTVERNDLGAFFIDMALTAMYSAWDSYGHKLQRVTVNELESILDQIAPQIIVARPPQPTNEGEAVEQEQDFQLFLLRAGKRDPLAKRNAIDEHRRAEEEAYAAAQQSARGREWNRD